MGQQTAFVIENLKILTGMPFVKDMALSKPKDFLHVLEKMMCECREGGLEHFGWEAKSMCQEDVYKRLSVASKVFRRKIARRRHEA